MPSKPLPDYTLFLGCMIPYRYPFIEKASRLVLDKLGLKVFDIEGFTCCPDPTGVKPMNYLTWLSVAARNLAVAELHGRNVLHCQRDIRLRPFKKRQSIHGADV